MKEIRVFEDVEGITAAFSTKVIAQEEARRELAARGLLVVRPVQVHKARVQCVSEEQKNAYLTGGQTEIVFNDTDAVITACRGVALTMVHADCLPVYLCDPSSGAMGLAHAGWKGTCAGIAEKTALAMNEQLEASFDTMKAFIGPGIGFCCFEVGPEVYEQFAREYDYTDLCSVKKENEKYFLDLKEINRRQLAGLGISEIQVSPLCTVCEKELFFSYRRDKGTKGHMVASMYR